MRMKSGNIFMTTSYQKVLKYSLLAIAFGVGFAGILMPKIIRQAVKMVREYDFLKSPSNQSIHVPFNLATSDNTRHDDPRYV